MIKVKGLSKKFDQQVVLDGIDLDVAEGELLIILGESGSGKSVFLKHLIGLFKPDRGTVDIDGKDITTLREHELLKIRKNVGYLFQDGALYDFMTVFENVAFPLQEHTKLSAKEVDEKVKATLKTVGLEKAGNKFPAELSGGMRKRSALARAVILGTKILFCDEPTSGLDPLKSRQIMDLIAKITKDIHCTTVVASHDIPNSFRIADRLALIHQGKIIAHGKPQDLQSSKDPVVREFLD